MDVILVVVYTIVVFGAGYAFRGLIGRELKTIAVDLKADLARIEAAIKAKV